MISVDEINKLQADNKRLNDIIDSYQPRLEELKELNADYTELKAENEWLKEKMIRLTEENGNLIIRANTSYNNYKDTQRRLDELCKANIHNLALLSKAKKTLQEIKAIAEELLEKGLEPQSVEHQLRLKGKRELASIIIDLITKVEEE